MGVATAPAACADRGAGETVTAERAAASRTGTCRAARLFNAQKPFENLDMKVLGYVGYLGGARSKRSSSMCCPGLVSIRGCRERS